MYFFKDLLTFGFHADAKFDLVLFGLVGEVEELVVEFGGGGEEFYWAGE